MNFYTLNDLSEDNQKKINYLVGKAIHTVFEDFYFSNYRPFQTLFKKFIEIFNLQDHVKNVVRYFISDYEKTGKLHVCDAPSIRTFQIDEKLEKYYEEDLMVFDRSGTISISEAFDVDFARILFAKYGDDVLETLWNYTFFAPKTKEGEDFKPESFKGVPSEIVSLSEKTYFVDFLAKAFDLSVSESRLLELVYDFSVQEDLSDIMNSINANMNDDTGMELQFYSSILGETVNWLRNLLSTKGHLVPYGLLDKNCLMSFEIMNGIYSGSLEEYFSDVLFKDDCKNAYGLSSYDIGQEEKHIALSLLKGKSPANILLHGSIGSGKTEFAKTLAKESGKEVYFYMNDVEVDLHDKNSESFALAKLNSVLAIERNDTVLIIDEAESILNTKTTDPRESSTKKASVNKMLENSRNKVIWVLNYTEPLDESTKRRFNYAIRFNEMSQDQIRKIASSKLKPLSLASSLESKIVELCAKYRITGYSVENIVRLISNLDVKNLTNEEILNYVKIMLESNSSLLFGLPVKHDKLSNHYKPDLVNSSLPVDDVLKMIENSLSYEKLVKNENFSIRVLFNGKQGTGKREMVKYIAHKLNRVILNLDFLSVFNDTYFPETLSRCLTNAFMTEKIVCLENFNNVFLEETKIAPEILERFFQVLNDFKGILFCTTNVEKITNPELKKHFHISVSFDYMKEKSVPKALKEYFGFVKFTKEQVTRLQEYRNISLEDFNSVTDIVRFYPKESITSDFIIDELVRIQTEKNNRSKIGFMD